MKEIGGYYSLEVDRERQKTFHSSFYAFNSARSGLLSLLNEKNIKSIYLPNYSCSELSCFLIESNIDVKYYNIDDSFEIIQPDDIYEKCVLYINYFGLKQPYIKNISKEFKRLIVDNAQAYFTPPINNVDTIYSCRKFWGVPDGGFLYTRQTIDTNKYPLDSSFMNCLHLLRRHDSYAQDGYADFQKNEDVIHNKGIRQMSRLTRSLLSNCNCSFAQTRREGNFEHLNNNLNSLNLLDLDDNNFPHFAYPLLVKNGPEIRKKLIKSKIYTPTYWPNLNIKPSTHPSEFNFVENIVSIPIDQRYDLNDMDLMIGILRKLLK